MAGMGPTPAARSTSLRLNTVLRSSRSGCSVPILQAHSDFRQQLRVRLRKMHGDGFASYTGRKYRANTSTRVTLQFDVHEGHWPGAGIEDDMLNTRFAKIGDPWAELQRAHASCGD